MPTQLFARNKQSWVDGSGHLVAAQPCALPGARPTGIAIGGAYSRPSQSVRNGKSCVARFRRVSSRRESFGPEPASPIRRWGNSESSLRAGVDFSSSARRVRSREWAARPIPSRDPNAGSDCCRRRFEFFHSKGVNAEGAPKNGLAGRVPSLQLQAKSQLTVHRAKVRTKRLCLSRHGKNRRFVGFGSRVFYQYKRTIVTSPMDLIRIGAKR